VAADLAAALGQTERAIRESTQQAKLQLVAFLVVDRIASNYAPLIHVRLLGRVAAPGLAGAAAAQLHSKIDFLAPCDLLARYKPVAFTPAIGRAIGVRWAPPQSVAANAAADALAVDADATGVAPSQPGSPLHEVYQVEHVPLDPAKRRGNASSSSSSNNNNNNNNNTAAAAAATTSESASEGAGAGQQPPWSPLGQELWCLYGPGALRALGISARAAIAATGAVVPSRQWSLAVAAAVEHGHLMPAAATPPRAVWLRSAGEAAHWSAAQLAAYSPRRPFMSVGLRGSRVGSGELFRILLTVAIDPWMNPDHVLYSVQALMTTAAAAPSAVRVTSLSARRPGGGLIDGVRPCFNSK